jgi:alkylation response protein AidB-like acyl-CoA dehydrogenase
MAALSRLPAALVLAYTRPSTRTESRMYAFDPDEEQQLIIDTARDFAKKQMAPRAHDADEASQLPDGFLAQAWELGLAVASIPEKYNGAAVERSAVTGALLLEELGVGDLSMALSMLAPATFAYPILDYGTEAQKAQWLPLCTQSAFPKVTAALIEPSLEFDVTALSCRAEKTASGYTLRGSKCLVPNGSGAEAFLVYAREGQAEGFASVQAFVVPRGASGLRVSSKEKNMGIHALDSVELTLDGVSVPAEARIGGDKGIDFERLMSYSRVALSALALGVARAAYEHSIAYAKERKTFGKPIATRQAIAFMLADMRIELDAARLLVWEAAWQLDQGNMATKETYLAKLYADEMVLKVTDDAVMVMGGHGFIRENPVERWLRDGRGFAAFEGLAMV